MPYVNTCLVLTPLPDELGKSTPDASVFPTAIGEIVVQHDECTLLEHRAAEGQGLTRAGERVAVYENDAGFLDTPLLCAVLQ